MLQIHIDRDDCGITFVYFVTLTTIDIFIGNPTLTTYIHPGDAAGLENTTGRRSDLRHLSIQRQVPDIDLVDTLI